MFGFLHTAKYFPLIAAAILIIGWIASIFGSYAVTFGVPFSGLRCTIEGSRGSVGGDYDSVRWRDNGYYWYRYDEPVTSRTIAGTFMARRLYKSTFGNYWHAEMPYLVVLTAILPLAVGPFISYRFRLRHFLAFTALIAIELAYYGDKAVLVETSIGLEPVQVAVCQ